MVESTIEISNRLGLHARAAARLVHLASTFKSRISIERAENRQTADSKSILGVLLLAASRGTKLTFRAEGEDEVTALAAIVDLVESRFGE